MTLKASRAWLCWHCDASIPKGSHLCPFCGSSLEIPPESSTFPEYQIPVQPPNEDSKTPNQLLLLALSLIGSTLISFSLFLLFFSVDGSLKIQWNAQLWPLYLLIGVSFFAWAMRRAI